MNEEQHYLANEKTKKVHDVTRLDERCNTDDLAQRNYKDAEQVSSLLNHGYRFCYWCVRRHGV